jgi:hypothetical protein
MHAQARDCHKITEMAKKRNASIFRGKDQREQSTGSTATFKDVSDKCTASIFRVEELSTGSEVKR